MKIYDDDYEETGKDIICSLCHGTGSRSHYGASYALECANCEGSGRIPVVRPKRT